MIMKRRTVKLILIVATGLVGSLGLLAISGILGLATTAENFRIGSSLFLLGWFLLAAVGYFSLRFKPLVNAVVLVAALVYSAYHAIMTYASDYVVAPDTSDRWAILLMLSTAALLLAKVIVPHAVKSAVIGGYQEPKRAADTGAESEPTPRNWRRFDNITAFYGFQTAMWLYALAWLGLHWLVWVWLDIPMLSMRIMAEMALIMFMPNWELLIRFHGWQSRKYAEGQLHHLRPTL
jgi:hypothetical protein